MPFYSALLTVTQPPCVYVLGFRVTNICYHVGQDHFMFFSRTFIEHVYVEAEGVK